MKSTNITIKVESDLAHEAKVFAARHGVSLSQLKKGFDLGWEKPANRDELHDRESIR
jgi:hypothetical protein